MAPEPRYTHALRTSGVRPAHFLKNHFSHPVCSHLFLGFVFEKRSAYKKIKKGNKIKQPGHQNCAHVSFGFLGGPLAPETKVGVALFGPVIVLVVVAADDSLASTWLPRGY